MGRYCPRHGRVDGRGGPTVCPREGCHKRLQKTAPAEPRKRWKGSLRGQAGGRLPASPPPRPYHPDWLSAEEARRREAAGESLHG